MIARVEVGLARVEVGTGQLFSYFVERLLHIWPVLPGFSPETGQERAFCEELLPDFCTQPAIRYFYIEGF